MKPWRATPRWAHCFKGLHMTPRNQVLVTELQDEEMLAAIDRALQLLQQPGDLLNAIGGKIEKNAEHRFDEKVDPSGVSWAPLSPTTIEIYGSEWFKKRPENAVYRPGIPGTLLDRTRQLRDSLTHNAGVDYVEIGTSRQVGKKKWQVGLLHEWGTEKMPRRGILTANPQRGELGAGDTEDVLGIVNSYIGAAFG